MQLDQAEVATWLDATEAPLLAHRVLYFRMGDGRIGELDVWIGSKAGWSRGMPQAAADPQWNVTDFHGLVVAAKLQTTRGGLGCEGGDE